MMLSEEDRLPGIGVGNRSGSDLPVARLKPDLFSLLFKGCKAERYSAKQHLFMQEDSSDRVYGIISGTIEISLYSPGGRK
ncbi:cyclic nucleotide-binding domain-containing protein, partial [Mesorhizobium sp.]|uniref:cyclic nucleotide-binding domain-containing protein n=1 Tax=Mesorhizobium sp. TaxID=1871066 RepID=UPI00345C4EDA